MLFTKTVVFALNQGQMVIRWAISRYIGGVVLCGRDLSVSSPWPRSNSLDQFGPMLDAGGAASAALQAFLILRDDRTQQYPNVLPGQRAVLF
jgi:hypothetical protein